MSLAAQAYFPFPQLRITDDEFRSLRDLIHSVSGIHIADNRKYLLQNRLSPRLRELGVDSFARYLDLLRGSNRTPELNKLFELITTNETSFFRNPPQLEYFQNVLLPQAIEKQRKRNDKRLRLFSAGCSSGEEAYTLSIILSEVLKGELSSWNVRITAADLSEAVLRKAREGLYDEYALRSTAPQILKKYFTEEGELRRVRPEVKKLVSLVRVNLNDRASLAKIEPSHFIFCRNVIIYFDQDMKRRLAEAFYENLLPGGCLLIGHSESLNGITEVFRQVRHPGAVAYLKERV